MPKVIKKKTAVSKTNLHESFINRYKPFLQKPKTLAIGGVLLLVLALFLLRSIFVAALVNGVPISRFAVVKALETQGGKEVLDELITKQLVLQEAKKNKISISDAEINTELKKIEDSVTSQGQNFNDLLKAKNLSRDVLKDKIKLDKIIQKIVGKEVTITDKEIQDYITANKESFPPSATIDELKGSVKEQLLQQKMSEKFQSWIAALKDKAKIYRFVWY